MDLWSSVVAVSQEFGRVLGWGAGVDILESVKIWELALPSWKRSLEFPVPDAAPSDIVYVV
jgi:hypothetical protein